MNTLKIGDSGQEVKVLQEALNNNGANPLLKPDGNFGPKTLEAVKLFQNRSLLVITGTVDSNTWGKLGVSDSNFDYTTLDWTPVINFEVGNFDYYNKYLKKATWPGGSSGVTWGYGADFGFLSQSEYDIYFSKYFTPEQRVRMKAVIGYKGIAAKNKLSTVKDIELSWDDARKIFDAWTLPKFWKMTIQIWPGLEKLCPKAIVALVSIVFNRGNSLVGDSRREMKAIQGLVPKKAYKEIAFQIRSMKRLWVGQNLPGLIKRREEEAKMVESCI